MGFLHSEDLQYNQYLTSNWPDTTSRDRESKDALQIQEMKTYCDHLNYLIGRAQSTQGQRNMGVVVW